MAITINEGFNYRESSSDSWTSLILGSHGPCAPLSTLSDEYNSSLTYALGSYCIYNNVLYKCIVPITTAESWTSEHWLATTVTQALMQNSPLIFNNIIVPATSFIENTTYSTYPYRAAIALSGVTLAMMADIILNINDATNGIFAPTCDSYNGGVYIYANQIPSDAITIPTIIVWRANI